MTNQTSGTLTRKGFIRRAAVGAAMAGAGVLGFSGTARAQTPVGQGKGAFVIMKYDLPVTPIAAAQGGREKFFAVAKDDEEGLVGIGCIAQPGQSVGPVPVVGGSVELQGVSVDAPHIVPISGMFDLTNETEIGLTRGLIYKSTKGQPLTYDSTGKPILPFPAPPGQPGYLLFLYLLGYDVPLPRFVPNPAGGTPWELAAINLDGRLKLLITPGNTANGFFKGFATLVCFGSNLPPVLSPPYDNNMGVGYVTDVPVLISNSGRLNEYGYTPDATLSRITLFDRCGD